MDSAKLEEVLKVILDFARSNDQILALGLCGSHARGKARPDSDIDLSILVEDQQLFKKIDWIAQVDFGKINEKIASLRDEVYGVVWSRHVLLTSQTEIEFSFADKSWADTDNLDEGTRKVVNDGYKILYDPHQILAKLVNKVQNLP